MHLLKDLATFLTRRQRPHSAPSTHRPAPNRQRTAITPPTAPQPATALRGTIILADILPAPISPLPESAAWYAPRLPAISRRFGAYAADYYATLSPMTSRIFPSNYDRLCWRQQQRFQRWLWRTNNPLARELARIEDWVWE